MKWLLKFLFGKTADIFNPAGRVHHDLGRQKWEAWNNRLAANPDYNWRHHKGKNEASEPSEAPKKLDSKD